MKILTKSEKETLALGEKFGKKLKGGEVIALQGNLGAGKTILTKGIAKGLGIKNIVNSPTFILMNIYDVKKNDIKQLVHVDCYRIKKPDEIVNIGLEEYYYGQDCVVIIEWPEKIKEILPKNLIKISIKIKDGDQREVTVTN